MENKVPFNESNKPEETLPHHSLTDLVEDEVVQEEMEAAEQRSYTDISGDEIIVEENFRVISPGRMVAKRFFRSKLSIAGLCMIIFVFLFSFLGPVITDAVWGYGETQMFKIERVSDMVSKGDFYAADGKEYTYYDRSESIVSFKGPPSKDHWLGTDTSGFDILVRLMYGGRISLVISFIVIFLETIIGIVLVGFAGYFGKWVDQVVMRVVDIFACLPGMPILSSSPRNRLHREHSGGAPHLLPHGVPDADGLDGCCAHRPRPDPDAARAGIHARCGDHRPFRHAQDLQAPDPERHAKLIVSMTLGLGGIILYESTLSYLGLGVPFPRAAWGSMIALADPSKGQEILANYPNMWVPAGVLIIITVLGFSFIGDGLRDAFDPRMKR